MEISLPRHGFWSRICFRNNENKTSQKLKATNLNAVKIQLPLLFIIVKRMGGKHDHNSGFNIFFVGSKMYHVAQLISHFLFMSSKFNSASLCLFLPYLSTFAEYFCQTVCPRTTILTTYLPQTYKISFIYLCIYAFVGREY